MAKWIVNLCLNGWIVLLRGFLRGVLLILLRKCVSYHKNPHLSNPFTKPSHTNQPSSAVMMAHPSPSDHRKLSLSSQPSSAATMAHPSPSGHGKLSLSSQPSSAATMAHPSPSGHRKLSLSSQPSSAALMAHPTPGNPLNPPALINPHFRQSPHTPITTSRPESNSRGDGCRLATTLQEGS